MFKKKWFFATSAVIVLPLPLVTSCGTVVSPDIEIQGDKYFQWDAKKMVSFLQIKWRNFYSDNITKPEINFTDTSFKFDEYFKETSNTKNEGVWSFYFECIKSPSDEDLSFHKEITIVEHPLHTDYKKTTTINTNDSVYNMQTELIGSIDPKADPAIFVNDSQLKQGGDTQYDSLDIVNDGYRNNKHETKYLSVNIFKADLIYTAKQLCSNLENAEIASFPGLGNISLSNLEDNFKVTYDIKYDFSTQIIEYMEVNVEVHPTVNVPYLPSFKDNLLKLNFTYHNYKIIGAFSGWQDNREDWGSFHDDYHDKSYLKAARFIDIVPDSVQSYATMNFELQLNLLIPLTLSDNMLYWLQNPCIAGFDRFASPDGYWFAALSDVRNEGFLIDSYWLKNVEANNIHPVPINIDLIDPRYVNGYSTDDDFRLNYLGNGYENYNDGTIFPQHANQLYWDFRPFFGDESSFTTKGYDVNNDNHSEVVQKWHDMATNPDYQQINTNIEDVNAVPYYQTINAVSCSPNTGGSGVLYNYILINPVFCYSDSNNQKNLKLNIGPITSYTN